MHFNDNIESELIDQITISAFDGMFGGRVAGRLISRPGVCKYQYVLINVVGHPRCVVWRVYRSMGFVSNFRAMNSRFVLDRQGVMGVERGYTTTMEWGRLGYREDLRSLPSFGTVLGSNVCKHSW